MSKKEEKLTFSADSAQSGDSKEAVNAEVSNLQTGENKDLAAGGEQVKDDEFDALIRGKYKKQFERVVQKIIRRRIKEVKNLKETEERNAQIIESLMKKFNIEDNDAEKLERTIDEKMTRENENIQERTISAIRALMAENNSLKKNHEEELRNLRTRNRVDLWKAQAIEAQKAYPEFDFEKELENAEFCRLLKVGVSVKNAYEVINIEKILDTNSKSAERKVVDSIRNKGSRPVENGSDAAGGVLLSGNVSKLSKKQRAELAKRAAKGERISF